MPFSDSVIRQAFSRSGGRCECSRPHAGAAGGPHQGDRCPVTFAEEGGNWHARHKVPEAQGGSNTVFNAEILCDACNDYAAVSP